MLLDIRPDHLQIVQAILQKHISDYKVWAFGSRAKWTANEYSDLDLCVITKEPLSFTILGLLAEDFSESNLPWKVDVVDWSTTAESFQKIIEKDKVIIQKAAKRSCGMSSEWIEYKMSDVVDVSQGLAINAKTKHLFREDGLPLLRISDLFSGKYSQFLSADYVPQQCIANKDEIIYTRTGQVGYVFTKKEGVVHNNCFKVTPKNEILIKEFLYWFLYQSTVREYANTIASGSVQKDLTHSAFKTIKISIPNRNSQKQISSILSALDDRITLLRETNATLEAIAQALFKSWFVDFDPVHAKAQGTKPEGMDEQTAALFPDSFEESELGMVPAGWEVGKVADIGEVICGKTPPTSEAANYGEDVPFITIPDMHNSLVITSTNRSLSTVGANTQKKKTLPVGSVCVSCIATAGLVAQVTTPSQTNQQINSVVPFEKWGSSFALFTLRLIGDAVRASGSGGSVFHNLNKSGFEQLKVLFPFKELASAFNKVIEPIVDQITFNQQQAKTLADLRDTLLPRLISGQLRLPDVVDHLGEI